MQSERIAYKEIYDYSRLEKAAKCLQLEETEESEVWLLNLHNHLVWHSYEPGSDPAADAILLSVLKELLEENNLDVSAVPAEFREIASTVVERRQAQYESQ